MATQQPTDKLRFILTSFGVTLIALLVVWGGYRLIARPRTSKTAKLFSSPTQQYSTSKVPAFENIGEEELSVPSAETDTDNDGLSDALETLYKTDPLNPDTDDDGYIDGTEVANGYDPTIPSPNDKITTQSSPTPPVKISPPTYTQQFLNRTGLPPEQESITENQEELASFVNDLNSRGVLPLIPDNDIQTTPASGKEAIMHYLDQISLPQNPKLQTVDAEDITSAFSTFTSTDDSTSLDKVIDDLTNNIEIIREVEVPEEALELHRKYLAASTALRDNTKLLKNYQKDYVGALVAGSRIELLRPVFEEVARNIQNLEKKYNIT